MDEEVEEDPPPSAPSQGSVRVTDGAGGARGIGATLDVDEARGVVAATYASPRTAAATLRLCSSIGVRPRPSLGRTRRISPSAASPAASIAASLATSLATSLSTSVATSFAATIPADPPADVPRDLPADPPAEAPRDPPVDPPAETAPGPRIECLDASPAAHASPVASIASSPVATDAVLSLRRGRIRRDQRLEARPPGRRPSRAARTPVAPHRKAVVVAGVRPLHGDLVESARAQGVEDEVPARAPTRGRAKADLGEPAPPRTGEFDVPAEVGRSLDVRERASKRETPSRGREGAKRGGCGGAGRAEVGLAGVGWGRSAVALSAGAVADGERFRRRLGSTSVPDAAGTGRSGREASPGGPADRGSDGTSSAEQGRTGASCTA